jgi:hypothetical protein
MPDWLVLVGVLATLGLIYVVIKFFDKMSEGFESKLQEESEIKCKELDNVIHSIEEDPSVKLNLLDKVTLIETRTSQGKQSLQRIDSGGNLYANGDGLSYVGVHRRMEWKWKNILHTINNRDSRPVNLDTLLIDLFFGGLFKHLTDKKSMQNILLPVSNRQRNSGIHFQARDEVREKVVEIIQYFIDNHSIGQSKNKNKNTGKSTQNIVVNINQTISDSVIQGDITNIGHNE